MKTQPSAALTGLHGRAYTADADGLITNVETGDILALQEQGAVTTTVGPVKHLKLLVSHGLYFEGRIHHSDGNGILRDVPLDHANALLADATHQIAREATQDELDAPLPAAPEPEAPLAEQPALLPEPATTPDPASAPAAEPAPKAEQKNSKAKAKAE
ncbi:hypothetical protein [Roseicella sp. DB1501]|uniref:hypothetical protein n=1 Tax=Roseicella sp. DB1501 TaxID=2730925 RepID=UPI001490962B|nr:hypothetical protein [Roseicella sp. DB1501]NOG73763.1 hypothetical protein [Roseicella sp. DB1501]